MTLYILPQVFPFGDTHTISPFGQTTMRIFEPETTM